MSLPLARCAACRTGSCCEARPKRSNTKGQDNDIDLYIGLDVSLASTTICVVSAQGKVVKETAALSEPEALVGVLRGLPGRVVGIRAGSWATIAMAVSAFDRGWLRHRFDGNPAGAGCAEGDADQSRPA